MSTRETLEQITTLAVAHRVARIGYRRPGDFGPHEFVIEPYRLQRTPAGGAAVHAWQVTPAPEGRADAWRDFRLDRITSVADGGQPFRPRAAVTLGHELTAPATTAGTGAGTGTDAARQQPAETFQWWGDRPIAAMGPAEDYFRHLEAAMLDGKVTPDEVGLARALAERVEVHERKAAHARVYANVLHEVLQDSRISHREELYLRNVRQFLEQLGWAP